MRREWVAFVLVLVTFLFYMQRLIYTTTEHSATARRISILQHQLADVEVAVADASSTLLASKLAVSRQPRAGSRADGDPIIASLAELFGVGSNFSSPAGEGVVLVVDAAAVEMARGALRSLRSAWVKYQAHVVTADPAVAGDAELRELCTHDPVLISRPQASARGDGGAVAPLPLGYALLHSRFETTLYVSADTHFCIPAFPIFHQVRYNDLAVVLTPALVSHFAPALAAAAPEPPGASPAALTAAAAAVVGRYATPPSAAATDAPPATLPWVAAAAPSTSFLLFRATRGVRGLLARWAAVAAAGTSEAAALAAELDSAATRGGLRGGVKWYAISPEYRLSGWDAPGGATPAWLVFPVYAVAAPSAAVGAARCAAANSPNTAGRLFGFGDAAPSPTASAILGAGGRASIGRVVYWWREAGDAPQSACRCSAPRAAHDVYFHKSLDAEAPRAGGTTE